MKQTFYDYLEKERLGNEALQVYLKENKLRHNWISDKNMQKSGIDLQVLKYGKLVNIDLKYDFYLRPNSIVGEITQKDGTTWFDKNKQTDLLWYAMVGENKIYEIDFKGMVDMIDLNNYKSINTKYTEARFCIIPIEDLPVLQEIEVDFTNLHSYVKENIL